MRYGLLAMICTFVVFFAIVLPLIFRKGLDARQSDYRLGLVFVLIGFFLTGWTVYYWNTVYAIFLFLLGSGVWLLDAAPGRVPVDPATGRRSAAPERRRRLIEEATASAAAAGPPRASRRLRLSRTGAETPSRLGP
jgi:hypothetical protein